MPSELQRLVDGVAQRTGRSIAIDDPRLRLLAYSAHQGEVDPARQQSILRREVSGELVAWVRDHVPKDSDEPFHLPLHPDLGLTIDRLCVPIRHRTVLLGFLWVLLTEPADDRLVAIAREVAQDVGVLLLRESFLEEIAHSRERELVRDLLDQDASVRDFAAEQLARDELFVAGDTCVLVTAGRMDQVPPDSWRVGLELALQRARREFPARHCLHLVRPDHAVLIVAPAGTWWHRRPLTEIGDSLRAHCRRELIADEPLWVGIAPRGSSLREVHGLYEQALRAVEVARLVRTLGHTVLADGLGVYGLLAEIPQERLQVVGLHPGLQALLDQDDPQSRTLVESVEVFLENAGDIKATAESLSVHRTSLYNRLHRFEQLAGVNLRSGDDRLVIHLALKLARLTGRR
ncbi:PucR family transcriptional regulator [Spongiactinospora rosea]|uniref:PucR family transcriptional regulator n=1 Tax=Spongiactinospora rosea TaxID=2248750 RepID=UPI0011C029EE|nr:helix-turn-helix domain-containing protein [Spongiactinospora rosea]